MTTLDPTTLSLSGTQLIEASAGTGKTYTITSLFLRLVLAGYPVNEILVVTFTEAATKELRNRLRSRLREALAAFQGGEGDDFLRTLVAGIPAVVHPTARRALQAALSGFDEAAVMTIHGFCRRMLRENAFESGVLFDAELLTDPQPLYEEIAQDYWALGVYDLPAVWVRLLQEQGVTHTVLARLARDVASHPDHQILPESLGGQDVPAAFAERYQAARNTWTADHAEITELLKTHTGVNRRSYNRPNLQRWLDKTAAYLSQETPAGLPGEADLQKFTRSRLADMAGRLKNSPPPPTHPFFDICEALCRMGQAWLLGFQRRFIDYATTELARRKRDMGAQFFNDLIQDLDRALAAPGADVLAGRIRRRYPAALIDEFQDTDQAQYRIFRKVYQGTGQPFFLIGDPKQSIYAFRGADIFAYLRAVTDADAPPHSLAVNWRSDPSLIRAVNTLFDPNRVPRPFGMPEISYTAVSPRAEAADCLYVDGRIIPALELLFVERNGNTGARSPLITKQWADDHIPGMLAGDIGRLLTGNAALSGGAMERSGRCVAPGDIAVLVRTNRQARLVQAALRRVGVACVIGSGESVFTSDEAFELWQVLLAVSDPSDSVLVCNALATDLMGRTGNEIQHLRTGAGAWEWWVMRFRQWHRYWQTGHFIRMLHHIFTIRAPDGNEPLLMGLLGLVDGERRVTNFKHLAELLHAAVVREHLGPAGLLRWFGNQRSGQGDGMDDHELRLESDARAVKAVTIHKSKGLEYPVVYAPYLWDGKLNNENRVPAICHDPSDADRALFDLGSPQLHAHQAQAGIEEMAENFRLLYVSLTRARHACRVVWGAINAFETSALGYLLHHPGAPADFAAVAAHVKGLDDVAIRADLTRLIEAAGGAIDVRDLAAAGDTRYTPPQDGTPDLACRQAGRIPERRWRMESFSSLAADAAHVTTPDEELGVDHDLRTGSPELAAIARDIPSPGHGDVPLAEFSRGANAGTFFHNIYEHMDFTASEPAALDPLVTQQLSEFGFEPADWLETVSRSIAATLACPLDRDRDGLALERIPDHQRLNELEFLLPVAHDAHASQARVTPGQLAKQFADHGSAAVPQSYPAQVTRLRFPAIQGFLKGFIDLVFEYQGKWYLVDYKSNHLGTQFADYRQPALSQAMAEHHYFLQYHLYTLALHRYLSRRLPDYDYETHFGCVYYLFIRGMAPETGPDFGVFRDRPTHRLVSSLSKLFAGCGD